ncbi:hypothetical protein BC628DRAFT_627466 [Trametes gibbosa]|nr:hypothetical protein BC628DRAFT_627466 [Trametes gibbosa]
MAALARPVLPAVRTLARSICARCYLWWVRRPCRQRGARPPLPLPRTHTPYRTPLWTRARGVSARQSVPSRISITNVINCQLCETPAGPGGARRDGSRTDAHGSHGDAEPLTTHTPARDGDEARRRDDARAWRLEQSESDRPHSMVHPSRSACVQPSVCR